MFLLSLIPAGCGKIDFESEKERPKVEKAFFEKAVIEYGGIQPRIQSEATSGQKDASISEEAIPVTP
jgi:hypothetical protein